MRVEEKVCEDCGKPLSEEDERSSAPTLCDSCETARDYDRASGPLAGMEAVVGNAGWAIRDRQTGEWKVDGYDSEIEAWIAYLSPPAGVPGRRYLYARFDVTGLAHEEIEVLELEVAVQAEASDADEGHHPGHPSVQVETWLGPPAPRARASRAGASRAGASEAPASSSKRYVATFRPQAWQGDQAVPVDPEGETTWDCTAFVAEIVAKPGTGGAQWLLATLEGGDHDDILRIDPAAPTWVKEWRGPFDTHLEVVDGPFVVTAVAFQHKIQGEGVGGFEWDLDADEARRRISETGVYGDPNYETFERTFTFETFDKEAITAYIDAEVWVDTHPAPADESVRYGGERFAARPEDQSFLSLVDTAWWNLMQGDLMLAAEGDVDEDGNEDAETAALVLAMAALARETIAATAGAIDQYDGKGEVIASVSDEELARRCAGALALLFYGGGDGSE